MSSLASLVLPFGFSTGTSDNGPRFLTSGLDYQGSERGLNCFLQGQPISSGVKNLNLFVAGNISVDPTAVSFVSSSPLFILGEFLTSQLSLFVSGVWSSPVSTSGHVPLFLKNYEYGESLNLFAKGMPISSGIGFIPLFTAGTTGPTTYSLSQSAPLFVLGSHYSSYLNLYTTGINLPVGISGNLNLFLDGFTEITGNSSNFVDLFVYNSSGESSSGIPLFVEGFGETEGYVSASGQLNAFIKVMPGSEMSLDMFIHGNAPTSGYLNTFILSAIGCPESGIPLFIHASDNISQDLKLFTRGYLT